MGSIPGWGIKIPHAMWCSQKKKIIKIIHFTSYASYHNLIMCVCVCIYIHIYIPLKEKRENRIKKECIKVSIHNSEACFSFGRKLSLKDVKGASIKIK